MQQIVDASQEGVGATPDSGCTRPATARLSSTNSRAGVWCRAVDCYWIAGHL